MNVAGNVCFSPPNICRRSFTPLNSCWFDVCGCVSTALSLFAATAAKYSERFAVFILRSPSGSPDHEILSSLAQPFCRLANDRLERQPGPAPECALPDCHHAPSVCFQLPDGAPVDKAVPSDLCPPECASRRRPSEKVAAVSVPETAVDKDDGMIARKGKI